MSDNLFAFADNIKNERKVKMESVNKSMLIGDVLNAAPETAQFFLAMGMHCLGCPSARGESIEQACMVHGTDADELVNNINQFLAKNK